MIFLLLSQLFFCTLAALEALQCLSCLSNENNGKFCRRISDAQTTNCPSSSTFCTAVVFLKNGQVNVNRGCGGMVSNWGFGENECEIMSNDALLDIGMALYQCRGDTCNNIEPADGALSSLATQSQSDVLLQTKAVKQQQQSMSNDNIKASSSSFSNSMLNTNNNQGSNYGSLYIPAPPTQSNSAYAGGQEVLSAGEKDMQVIVTKKKIISTIRPTTTLAVTVMEEEEDTEAPAYQEQTTRTMATVRKILLTTPRPLTTTTEAEDVEEEAEAPAYQKPHTTTTTTTTKRRIQYPENEDVKEATALEVTVRPTRRRGLTVFDKRRK